MTFTAGEKLFVRYNNSITAPFTKLLTVKKFRDKLLYFAEKSDYYAVECNKGLFYGYAYTTAGNILVVKKRWHVMFALIAEKARRIMAPAAKRSKITLQQQSLAAFKNAAS